MKKTMRRTLGIVLVMAVAMSSVIGGNRTFGVPGAGRVRAAESAGKYISDMVISYADSKEKAEEELGEEYTVLDVDLNNGNSGHTWLGYSTTDDKDMAIRDIKVMDMNGGFSTSDYEELVKKYEKEFDEQMESIVPAVREFAKNYDAGVPAATGMMYYLNRFYENDSDKAMGDYLLDAGHALNKNPDDSAVYNDMKKVFLQGNTEIIKTIETILMQTQGSKLKKEGSWLSRMSELGPNGLTEIYEKANPNTPKAKIKTIMKKDLDDDAKLLLEQMPVVRELLGSTDHEKIRKALDEGDTKAFEELVKGEKVPELGSRIDENMSMEEGMDVLEQTLESNDVSTGNAQTLIDANLVLRMLSSPYGDSNMFDFFMREDLKAEDLYPMAYLLSPGQKSLMDDVGIHNVFRSIMAGDAEDVDDTEEDKKDPNSGAMISVYDGCDRGEFEGDTAVTTEAIKRSSSSGKSLFMDSAAYNIIMVSTALASVGAFVYAAKWKPKLIKVRPKVDFQTFFETEKQILRDEWGSLINQYEKTVDDVFKIKVEYIRKNKLLTKDTISTFYKQEELYKYYTVYDSALKDQNRKVYDKLNNKKNGYFTKLNKRYEVLFDKKDQAWRNLNAFDEKAAKKKYYNQVKEGSKAPKAAARAVGIVCGIVALAFAAYEIYCMTSSDKTSYTEIPGKIIDRSYPEGSEEIEFIDYYAVLNADEKKADIHRKKEDKWVSLYTSSDDAAGDPILAASLSTNENSTLSDSDMVSVSAFGESAPYKLSKGECSYMFFGRNENALSVSEKADTSEDTDAASGSESETDPDTKAAVFGTTTMWVIIALFAVVILAGGMGVWFRKRRKTK